MVCGLAAAALTACAPLPDELASQTVALVGHPASGPFSPVGESTWATATWPQGASFVGAEGTNLRFGVFAGNATRVVLEIYAAATGQAAQFDYVMARGSDGIWRAQLASVPGKALYGFRVWGPNWPFSASWAPGSQAGFASDVDASGNRYNPNKLLSDPYARELSHDKEAPAIAAAGLDGGMYGTGGASYRGAARRLFDTGPWAPKSVALLDSSTTGTRPAIAPRDAIVYEAHVRTLTAHPSASSLRSVLAGLPEFAGVVDIPAGCRGTYRAAGLMAPYLRGLGINVIELLPVHEVNNDLIPLAQSGGNFWGYATDAFFAPDRRYACDRSLGGPTAEWKAMVRAFHAAGIEVWLDVVYNHTGEGGNWDATKQAAELTSFRGFDNRAFYQLPASDPASYFETTGVGNNFNVATAVSRRLVLDSLRYWARSMGADGFRFDLAAELGRDAAPGFAFNPQAQLLVDIAALGASDGVDMVAEPWDLGAYGVGQFPNGWAEWNGKYRDATRRFLKGELSGANGMTYADVFYGAFSDYSDQGGAQRSINFVVAHDGFTLADLVSYTGKTNGSRQWPFGPSDGGSDSNDSWDSNGDHALRRQRFRNFFVWQMFSRGVPMIVSGDEFAKTQNGNNNPYNVDAPGNWNHYGMIASDTPHGIATGVAGEGYHNNFGTDARADGRNSQFQFARQLINLRRGSRALRQGDYAMPISFAKSDGTGGFNSSVDRAVRIHLDGSQVGDTDYVVYVNMWTAMLTFALPASDAGMRWVRVIDTAAWAETNDNFWSDASAVTINAGYGVHPWSIVVLKAVAN